MGLASYIDRKDRGNTKDTIEIVMISAFFLYENMHEILRGWNWRWYSISNLIEVCDAQENEIKFMRKSMRNESFVLLVSRNFNSRKASTPAWKFPLNASHLQIAEKYAQKIFSSRSTRYSVSPARYCVLAVMEDNVSRDQFLTRVCVSRSLHYLLRARILLRRAALGGWCAREDTRVEGARGRRKKIDLKKNPGLEGSRLRGSCVNFSEFP